MQKTSHELSGARRQDSFLKALLRFPDRPLADSMAVLTMWSTYLIPYLFGGVALSHIFGLMFVCSASIVVARTNARKASAVFFLFLFVLFMSMLSGQMLGPTARFWSEAIKTLIVFLVTFFAGQTLSAERIYEILKPGPVLCILMVSFLLITSGNPFSIDGRLKFQGFISPNVLGYLLVLNIAVVLSKEKPKRLDYFLLLILFVMMLACFSRTALLSAVALIWVRIGFLRGALIFGSIGIALGIIFANNETIQRMLVIVDVITTGGSGRSSLWFDIITRWLYTPSAWLFGFGPGSVYRILNIFTKQEAAHSLFVGSLYYWGIAGAALLATILMFAAKGVYAAPSSIERKLARDILIITVVNGIADESYDGSQVNAVSALFFALVLAVAIQGSGWALKTLPSPPKEA